MKPKKLNETCDKCKYFEKHYVWCDNRFILTNCGHCLKRLRVKIFSPIGNSCEQWEMNEVQNTKSEDDIKKILKRISNYLEQLVLYVNSN